MGEVKYYYEETRAEVYETRYVTSGRTYEEIYGINFIGDFTILLFGCNTLYKFMRIATEEDFIVELKEEIEPEYGEIHKYLEIRPAGISMASILSLRRILSLRYRPLWGIFKRKRKTYRNVKGIHYDPRTKSLTLITPQKIESVDKVYLLESIEPLHVSGVRAAEGASIHLSPITLKLEARDTFTVEIVYKPYYNEYYVRIGEE